MKLVTKNSITNIEGTNTFDQKFLFKKASSYSDSTREIFYMSELLQKKENSDIMPLTKEKPAMHANVYSAEDELSIFIELFENALSEKKKIHIIWITLREEIEMLEKYYLELGFLREDINCFDVDFSIPLVTVSVNIENLMWKWSDYKKMRSAIFFIPPVRESSQNKAMFKWINRWVTAGIHIEKFWQAEEQFLSEQISNEKILPLTMGKVLFYNSDDAWIVGGSQDLEIEY